MLNFEKWFYANPESNNVNELHIDKVKDNANTDAIFLNPPEWWFGINIKNRAKNNSTGIASMFCAYIIRDNEPLDLISDSSHPYYKIQTGVNKGSDVTKTGTGRDIKVPIYHIFKKGVRHGNDVELFIDKSYADSSAYNTSIPISNNNLTEIENNGIKNFINIINKYDESLIFDGIEFPESKSQHINHFAYNTLIALERNNKIATNTQLSKIEKRDIDDMINDFIYNGKSVPPYNLLSHIFDNIKITGNNIDTETKINTFIEITKCVIKYEKHIIKHIINRLLPDSTLFDINTSESQQNLYLSIFLTSWLINLKAAKKHISSAADIRTLCNWFSKGDADVDSEYIKTLTKKYGFSIYLNKNRKFNKTTKTYTSPKNHNTYPVYSVIKQIFSNISGEDIKNISLSDTALDIYSQHYYKEHSFKDVKNKNSELNILFVDDNVNLGSTVYEASEAIKRKYAALADKINVHILVLLAPIQDIKEVWNKHFNKNGDYITNYNKPKLKLNYDKIKSPKQKEREQEHLKQEIKNTLSNILCNLFEKHGLPLDIYEAFYEDNIYTESIKDLDLIYYNIYNDKEYQDTLKQVEKHKLKFTENIQQILDNIKQGAIRYEEEKKKEKKEKIKSICIEILQNEATLYKIIERKIERPSNTKIRNMIKQIEDDCEKLKQDKDLYFINNYGTRSYLYSCNYKAILKYFIKSELEHVSDVDVKNDYKLLNKNSWDSATQEIFKSNFSI